MIDNLSTEVYRLQNANRLVNDIAANNYYFFIGDFLPHSNVSLQPVYDNTGNTLTWAWRNMLEGKAIVSNNVSMMINNIQWQSNTVYAMYDDQDPNLQFEQFFVITNEGSFYHIWKVLYNNFGAASTVQPLLSQANSTPFYQTADGYQWKYMATTVAATVTQFQTSNYFPFTPNTAVTQAAVPGAINAFIVESNGAFYNNYVSNGAFLVGDINVNGDPTLFNLSGNGVSTVNGYYTGCILNIVGGAGLGQFVPIINYTSNSTGNIIKIQSSLFPSPGAGTLYQIYPSANVTSGGLQTINCTAIALINALASNSVYQVQPLAVGQGYQYVANVNITANVVVGVANTALVRAVLPPKGGHGAHPHLELYCNSVGIAVTLANNEGNTILAVNEYQQIGILKNPLFANVSFGLAGVNGLFVAGEVLYNYTSQQLNTNATVTINTTSITCNTANFVNQLIANDYIIISNLSGNTQLTQVANVINTSSITITSNALFSCSQALIFAANLIGNSIITTGGSNNIVVTNCTPTFTTGGTIIGSQSGTSATVITSQRNGIIKGFQTFIQLNRVDATLVSGNFIPDEQLVQGNTIAELFAVVGVANNISIFYNNVIGTPLTLGQLVGANSGTVANVVTLYVPELIFSSADILYLENITPVTRANNQEETFQLVLNF